jgi:hypothetical protein
MTMLYSHLKPNHPESAMESIASGLMATEMATNLKADEPVTGPIKT